MGDAGDRSAHGRWRILAGVLVILLGVRTFYLFVGHLGGEPLRPRVEVAAIWLVLAGVLLVLSRGREVGPQPSDVRPSGVLPQTAVWLLFLLASFALYWPTISVGLLSDDFVLWERAAAWDFTPVSSVLFRPLPLLVWAVLIHAGASGLALHALNILFHGTNAYLATRLCSGWIGPGTASVLAGALMLVFPLASEPVSWLSGVFDLSMTALALAFVLRGRAYSGSVSLPQRATFVALGVLAMGAKETGVMASLLVLTDAWVRRSRPKHLLIDTAVVLALAASFAAVRLLGAFGLTSPNLTRYRIQRSVFETFGGLAVPFHADVVRQFPWLVILGVLIVLALFVAYFFAAGRRSDRFVFGGGAWILISVLPVFVFVFVGPDLQGARFLCLAAPAWCSLIAAIGDAVSRVAGRWVLLAVLGLVAVWAVAARADMAPWKEASIERDRILSAVKTSDALRECQTVRVKLTDNVRGAYVFRNGARQALRREAGLHVGDEARPECRFSWDERTGTFSRVPE